MLNPQKCANKVCDNIPFIGINSEYGEKRKFGTQLFYKYFLLLAIKCILCKNYNIAYRFLETPNALIII